MREALTFSRFCELYNNNDRLNRREIHKMLNKYVETQNYIKSGNLIPF